MRALLLFTAFAIITGTNVNAQDIYKGILKDSKTRQPLSYVNVGVVGKNVGTVSDANGGFSLRIPSDFDNDTLRISMVGFQPKVYRVSEFKKLASANSEIQLTEAVYDLKEVRVSNRRLTEKVLGNKTESKSTTAGFTSNKLGHEIGIIIKIKKSPTYLKDFNVSVASEQKKPIKLRLNFYSVKNGMPDTILLKKNIIVETKPNAGKISVDLEPYGIVAEDDVFVSLEWIENSGGHGLMFSASLFGSPLIARETSQSKWEKAGPFGVGFTVTAAY
ncbi:MAG: hypothetical protein K0S09_1976 [Sphingobacteriaceae bacterium]|jgi:hypothetical protein|nr:hypothetical protein [Sphingobacteriaceae bacterium]